MAQLLDLDPSEVGAVKADLGETEGRVNRAGSGYMGLLIRVVGSVRDHSAGRRMALRDPRSRIGLARSEDCEWSRSIVQISRIDRGGRVSAHVVGRRADPPVFGRHQTIPRTYEFDFSTGLEVEIPAVET